MLIIHFDCVHHKAEYLFHESKNEWGFLPLKCQCSINRLKDDMPVWTVYVYHGAQNKNNVADKLV